MKTKISAIVLGLCALAMFTACEKSGSDVLLPDANLSIRLCVDGPVSTKTVGDSTIVAEAEEYAISSLAICLVEADPVSTSPVTVVSSNRKVAWKLLSTGVYEVNAIIPDTVTGDCLLYVIANMPSWMTISTYADLCKSFTNTATNLAGCWTDNKFLMVNKQDDIDTPDNAGVAVTMASDPDDEKVEATVTIERLASKVLVKENPYMKVAPLLTEVLCTGDNTGDPDIKGAIVAMEIEQYALFNCVNSFNLIQRWSAASTTGDTEQLLVSPSSDYTTPYSMTDGYYDNDPYNLTFSDLGTVLYCMENNSPYYENLVAGPSDATAGTKMKGRVTGIVFKARAGFAKEFDGSLLIAEPLPVEDVPVTWATKAGSNDVIWDTFYQYKGNYYGDIPCLLANNPSLATTLGTTSPSADQLRANKVKVYEDGYVYYNYWIQDKNYTDNGQNYLSVMRNTFYDIKITAINSMGDEFPCGGDDYDDEDPISVDVPKLSISVDIPDWVNKEGNYTIQ